MKKESLNILSDNGRHKYRHDLKNEIIAQSDDINWTPTKHRLMAYSISFFTILMVAIVAAIGELGLGKLFSDLLYILTGFGVLGAISSVAALLITAENIEKTGYTEIHQLAERFRNEKEAVEKTCMAELRRDYLHLCPASDNQEVAGIYLTRILNQILVWC